MTAMDDSRAAARHIEGFWPARQARSRATQRRIVDAARVMLGDRTFDDLSVVDIARRAGCSVGAFYARFRDKDVLLSFLDQRHREVLQAAVASWPTADALDRVVQSFVAGYAAFCREHRGVIRALLMHARHETGPRRHSPGSDVAVLAAPLLARRSEIAHPDPQLAVHLTVATLVAVVRERIVFREPLGRGAPVTDAMLVDELSRVCAGYLKG